MKNSFRYFSGPNDPILGESILKWSDIQSVQDCETFKANEQHLGKIW